MDLSTREDIDAPIEWVFERITDDAAFERIALRRGADVTRVDGGTGFVAGAKWKFAFKFRGRERKVAARVVSVEAPNGWSCAFKAGGIEGTSKIELVAMSKTRTRMIIETSVVANTLSARLVLQSLKLAKTRVSKRFKDRVAGFATSLETRYRDQG